jgi:hypothetical protein
LVIALQEPALRSFDRLSHLIPNLLGYRLTLPPLSRDSARLLIRRVAADQGILIDDKVVEAFAMAPSAAAGDGVHPWLFTRGIEKLFEAAHKQKPPEANAAALELLGGADAVILQSLDTAINELNTSQRELLFRWCDVLISKEGRRLAATEKALRERAGNHGRYTASLTPLLLTNGILRVVTTDQTQRYELARESMTVILKDWWDRQEEVLNARRRAKFRVRSMSITAGLIALFYAVYLYLSLK